jgi:hypothetical protein
LAVLRFVLVAFAAFAALGCGLFLSSARSQTPGSIAGEWTGKYICAQGVTALRLTIAEKQGEAITATFNFGPLPENPGVPKGAYRMEGVYEPASRHLKLDGARWIEAPTGYVMVGLDGRLARDGKTIAGAVPDIPGCTIFEVSRGAPLIG